jgi:polar amino acid transport system substrate-binding protein
MLLLLIFLLAGAAFSAEPLLDWTIMTDELPPYNFSRQGKVFGASTDILLQILEKNNVRVDRKSIHVLPWPRAYQLALTTPGTILYSTARTDERENLFQWVGPITNITMGIIALKERNIQINTLQDLSKYTIGTIRDGAPDQLLLKAGIPESRLDRIASPESNIKKLLAGRIDLIGFSVLSARFLMQRMGLNPELFEAVYTLQERPLYFAFHKDSSKELIQSLNSTLKDMKIPDATGTCTVTRILNKYLE